MTADEIFALGAQGEKNELTREQLQRWIENRVYEEFKYNPDNNPPYVVTGDGVVMTDRAIQESEAEFRERYESHKQRSVEWGVTHLSVPCLCEDGGGPWHWACIRNTPAEIKMHYDHESTPSDNWIEWSHDYDPDIANKE